MTKMKKRETRNGLYGLDWFLVALAVEGRLVLGNLAPQCLLQPPSVLVPPCRYMGGFEKRGGRGRVSFSRDGRIMLMDL